MQRPRAGPVCRSQIANTDCSFHPRARLQGWWRSADSRPQMQLSNPHSTEFDSKMISVLRTKGLRAGSLQIPACKYRLQHAAERGAAGLGVSLQIPGCKCRLQHTTERGAAGTGMRCEKKTQNTDFLCRLQHFSLQMGSVRWHHSRAPTRVRF